MRLALGAALITLSAAAHATWYVSGDLESFRWQEDGTPSVTETGPRWGVSWGYLRERDAGWQFAYRGQFRRGTVDYNGVLLFAPNQAATAQTRYTGIVNEVQAIYRVLRPTGFELVGGLGVDYWERNILPDQKEDYYVGFARMGFNIDPRTTHALFGGAGVKLPFRVWENGHLDKLGFDSNPGLEPKGELSVYAQAGYRFTPTWSVIGYYDGYRFGESNSVLVTSSAFPGSRFFVFQPGSRIDSYGLRLQYEFK